MGTELQNVTDPADIYSAWGLLNVILFINPPYNTAIQRKRCNLGTAFAACLNFNASQESQHMCCFWVCRTNLQLRRFETHALYDDDDWNDGQLDLNYSGWSAQPSCIRSELMYSG